MRNFLIENSESLLVFLEKIINMNHYLSKREVLKILCEILENPEYELFKKKMIENKRFLILLMKNLCDEKKGIHQDALNALTKSFLKEYQQIQNEEVRIILQKNNEMLISFVKNMIEQEEVEDSEFTLYLLEGIKNPRI